MGIFVKANGNDMVDILSLFIKSKFERAEIMIDQLIQRHQTVLDSD